VEKWLRHGLDSRELKEAPDMFRRYLAVTAVSMVVVVGARLSTGLVERREPAIVVEEQLSTMSEADRERCERLADLQTRRDGYAQIAELLTKELARGAINLREATDRLFYYSIQNYPEHLGNVAVAEPRQNIKTCLARHLLRQFLWAREDGLGGPDVEAVVARLNREFRELPYEEERIGRLQQQ
jgi:hypothetical protein